MLLVANTFVLASCYEKQKFQICVTAAFWATDAFLSTRSTSRSPLQVGLAIQGDSLSVRKYCAPLSETQDLRLWYFVHRWYFVHHVPRAFLRAAS